MYTNHFFFFFIFVYIHTLGYTFLFRLHVRKRGLRSTTMCTSYLPVIIYTHCHSQTCCTTKYYLTKSQGMYGFFKNTSECSFSYYFFPNHKFRYKLSYLLVWPLPFHSGWHVQLRSDPGSFSTVKCDQEQGCILTRIELQQEQTRL